MMELIKILKYENNELRRQLRNPIMFIFFRRQIRMEIFINEQTIESAEKMIELNIPLCHLLAVEELKKICQNGQVN